MKNKLITFALSLMLILSTCITGCGKSETVVSDSASASVQETLVEKPETLEEKEEPKAEPKEEIEEETTDISESPEEDTAPAENEKAETIAYPSNSGRLHVSGTFILNENDEKVQLKGLSTHGLAWFPEYVNNSLFSEFRNNWNCNVVRLAMYSDEYGGYANGGNKTELRKLIDNGVKYATDNDMYVIIDWHILADGNPNTHKSEAIEFFKDVSAEYAGNNNVIYEICNEPNGGTDWPTIKKYAEEVIPVIRANDENAIIIVGTPTWSQEVDKAAANPITGYDNIMYALHFYADTHKDDLRNRMVSAIEAGLPIFVTEYGICDASGNGAINVEEANKWMNTIDKYMVSSCVWNISNKNETSAIFKSSVSKKSGFTKDDLSPSGKWFYEMMEGSINGGGTVIDTTPKTEDQSRQDKKEEQKDVDITHSSGALSYSLKKTNSWSSDKGEYYQYELTVTNSGEAVSSWSIDITFSENIELEQGWCGKYTVNGNVLTIANEDYNGSIGKDESTKDIGFIIISKSGLTVK